MNQSVNPAVVAIPPVSTDPASSPSPTVTYYQQVASEIVATIEAALARMPRLQIAHPAKARYLRFRQRFYSPVLITTAAVAVESNPELQDINLLDAEAGRSNLQYVEAFSELEAAVTRSLGNIRFTLQSVKWETTLRALQTYQIAKTMVRDPNSTLAAHVASMKKVVSRRQRRAAATPASPTVPEASGVTLDAAA